MLQTNNTSLDRAEATRSSHQKEEFRCWALKEVFKCLSSANLHHEKSTDLHILPAYWFSHQGCIMEEWYWSHWVLSTLSCLQQPQAQLGCRHSVSQISLLTQILQQEHEGSARTMLWCLLCEQMQKSPLLLSRRAPSHWAIGLFQQDGMVFPLRFVCQESNFLFLSWASRSWHWWRLGRMRGWFASGLTKHVFTITPFIPACAKLSFLERPHGPWIWPPKNLKQTH